jgi:S1-C subfamily serine protease
MKAPQTGLAVIAALLLVALFSFAIGTQTAATNAGPTSASIAAFTAPISAPPAARPVTEPIITTENERIYSTIYNEVAPSVVSINVVARRAGGMQQRDGLAQGSGTGFVVDREGHIMTNFHVVEGAVQIEVNFFDGRIVRGEIVGTDPDSDLALLRVSDVPAEALYPVVLGDSDALFIGQEVVAIGSPFNQRWTMTTGIISALDRTIQGLTRFSIGAVIQTDAAINPGNSGGPLLNLRGEVIGVNSQIISRTASNSGIGFAIPSNLVQRVLRELLENGQVNYSYLGISGDEMSLAYIDALNLPNTARGVVVAAVEPGSPAARAGLRNPANPITIDGRRVPRSVDIITAIDGVPIAGMPTLIAYLASNTQPGQTVTLTVLRNGTELLELPVTLSPRPGARTS